MIRCKALMRKCRQHPSSMEPGCFYCRRKNLSDVSSVLFPEDRLLRQIFGEGERFYTVNTKIHRRLRKRS